VSRELVEVDRGIFERLFGGYFEKVFDEVAILSALWSVVFWDSRLELGIPSIDPKADVITGYQDHFGFRVSMV
jgi:hypothetical protein